MNHEKINKNENMDLRFDLQFSQFYHHYKEAPSLGLEREEDKD